MVEVSKIEDDFVNAIKALKTIHEQLSHEVADVDSCDLSPETDEALTLATEILEIYEAGNHYSVLLLYPDEGYETETYYAHVIAGNREAAVKAARLEACKTNEWDTSRAEEFEELLVLKGHHYGL